MEAAASRLIGRDEVMNSNITKSADFDFCVDDNRSLQEWIDATKASGRYSAQVMAAGQAYVAGMDAHKHTERMSDERTN